jgi:hypothetical protein
MSLEVRDFADRSLTVWKLRGGGLIDYGFGGYGVFMLAVYVALEVGASGRDSAVRALDGGTGSWRHDCISK